MDPNTEREIVALAAMLQHMFMANRPQPQPQPETLPERFLIYDARRESFFLFDPEGDKDDGEPPATKAEIDNMPTVKITSKDEVQKMCETAGTECVICMEDWGVGDVVKEMPCQHKFHGGCVEKWLKIHATCPVCRCKMVEDEDENEKTSGGESESESDNESESVSFGITSVLVSFGVRD